MTACPVAHFVDQQDVADIMQCQRSMLTRFEKTNEMLVNCNALAAVRFERASRDLKAHSRVLEELKKDMEAIFRRIRLLRSKLSHDMPDAFAEGVEDDDGDEEVEEKVKF